MEIGVIKNEKTNHIALPRATSTEVH